MAALPKRFAPKALGNLLEEAVMKETRLDPLQEMLQAVTRRHFFKQAGFGIGSAALTALLNRRAFSAGLSSETTSSATAPVAAVNPLAPKPPMFAPKAKSVIYLFMAGAPSQVDLLDYKPKLQQYDGQGIPEEMIRASASPSSRERRNCWVRRYNFKTLGAVGRGDFGAAAPSRRNRRRHRHRQVDAHHPV